MVETNHSISQLSPQFRANIGMAVRVLAQRSAIEIVNHQLRARGLIGRLSPSHTTTSRRIPSRLQRRRSQWRNGDLRASSASELPGHILVQSATTPPRSGEVP